MHGRYVESQMILLAFGMFVAVDPGAVVRGYLRALQALDSAGMNRYLENRTANPDMRAFEREMHTKWAWRIRSIEGSTVVADETEANDFYDALGLGKRFQTCVFTVQADKILQLDVSDIRHERGNYREAYASFLDWLKAQAGANDPRFLRNADLRFTGESARALKPWLKKYRHARTGSPGESEPSRGHGTGNPTVRSWTGGLFSWS